MIPQTQSRVGKNGRCFEACIASILDLKEKDVPDFGLDAVFLENCTKFLDQFGLYYVQVPPTLQGLAIVWGPDKGEAFHTIEGESPRGGLHAVVGCNGDMVWDPHPVDGTEHGLVRVDCFGLICARLNTRNLLIERD